MPSTPPLDPDCLPNRAPRPNRSIGHVAVRNAHACFIAGPVRQQVIEKSASTRVRTSKRSPRPLNEKSRSVMTIDWLVKSVEMTLASTDEVSSGIPATSRRTPTSPCRLHRSNGGDARFRIQRCKCVATLGHAARRWSVGVAMQVFVVFRSGVRELAAALTSQAKQFLGFSTPRMLRVFDEPCQQPDCGRVVGGIERSPGLQPLGFQHLGGRQRLRRGCRRRRCLPQRVRARARKRHAAEHGDINPQEIRRGAYVDVDR